VCIVISEETRKISLAVEGRVMWALSEKELRDELTKAL
jgi:DNA integrity scanning protein DisA with diadenylate cyclase activity